MGDCLNSDKKVIGCDVYSHLLALVIAKLRKLTLVLRLHTMT